MSATNEPSKPQARLVVTDEGQYLLQGKVLSVAELEVALQALKRAQPDVDLHVVGSPKATYEQVAPAMHLVQRHGLEKLRFITGDPPNHDTAPECSLEVSFIRLNPNAA